MSGFQAFPPGFQTRITTSMLNVLKNVFWLGMEKFHYVYFTIAKKNIQGLSEKINFNTNLIFSLKNLCKYLENRKQKNCEINENKI